VNTAEILVGDAIARLRELGDGSVRTCVTSPPYWGLRDYGNDGQLGMEGSPQEFVENLCQVFDEVARVLTDDGTVWVNLGDSYNGAAPNRSGANGFNDGRTNRDKRFSVGGVQGLKPKDLVGIPWRFAFAMQDRGWYLRQDIIWAKPNPMPVVQAT
jgi:DNA modification methylase